jgi:hypothetical protein
MVNISEVDLSLLALEETLYTHGIGTPSSGAYTQISGAIFHRCGEIDGVIGQN